MLQIVLWQQASSKDPVTHLHSTDLLQQQQQQQQQQQKAV
jgi:hypothetical protein